jgi:hypothetical protein
MRTIALVCSALALGVSSQVTASETTTYSYDALGRLTTSGHSGTVNNNLQQSYSHDAADNRSNVTITNSPFSSLPQNVIVVPLNGYTVIPLPSYVY